MAVCYGKIASNLSPAERLSAVRWYWIHLTFLRTDKMNWQIATYLYFDGKLYAWVKSPRYPLAPGSS
jgi:hypothetical protein